MQKKNYVQEILRHHSQRSAARRSWPKNCLITMKRIWRMRWQSLTPDERRNRSIPFWAWILLPRSLLIWTMPSRT